MSGAKGLHAINLTVRVGCMVRNTHLENVRNEREEEARSAHHGRAQKDPLSGRCLGYCWDCCYPWRGYFYVQVGENIHNESDRQSATW